jgi:hypothetical protein
MRMSEQYQHTILILIPIISKQLRRIMKRVTMHSGFSILCRGPGRFTVPDKELHYTLLSARAGANETMYPRIVIGVLFR